MIRRFSMVALVSTFVACASPGSQSTPGGQTTGSGSATAASPVPCEDSDDHLGGRWRLLMGKTTWTVCLVPREGLPGEYLGKGQRDVPDETGRAVTMEIGAVQEKDVFRAWLGPGVIKCTGSFFPAKDVQGECIEMNGDSAGKFHAERFPTPR
jgi:hypothetical protein